jgi:hypothetical protein
MALVKQGICKFDVCQNSGKSLPEGLNIPIFTIDGNYYIDWIKKVTINQLSGGRS